MYKIREASEKIELPAPSLNRAWSYSSYQQEPNPSRETVREGDSLLSKNGEDERRVPPFISELRVRNQYDGATKNLISTSKRSLERGF